MRLYWPENETGTPRACVAQQKEGSSYDVHGGGWPRNAVAVVVVAAVFPGGLSFGSAVRVPSGGVQRTGVVR